MADLTQYERSIAGWTEIAKQVAESYPEKSETSELHLLLAIVDANAAKLADIGLKGPVFKRRIIEELHRASLGSKDEAVILPVRVAKVLAKAAKRAAEMQSETIDSEHILLVLAEMNASGAVLFPAGFKLSAFLDHLPHLDLVGLTGDLKALSVDTLSTNSPLGTTGFHVLIDPGDASSEEIAEVFSALSDLNRAMGGDGLSFVDSPDESQIIKGEPA